MGFSANLVEFSIEPLMCFAASHKKCLCKVKGWSLRVSCSVLVTSWCLRNALVR